jgi:hypothetical protein
MFLHITSRLAKALSDQRGLLGLDFQDFPLNGTDYYKVKLQNLIFNFVFQKHKSAITLQNKINQIYRLIS